VANLTGSRYTCQPGTAAWIVGTTTAVVDLTTLLTNTTDALQIAAAPDPVTAAGSFGNASAASSVDAFADTTRTGVSAANFAGTVAVSARPVDAQKTGAAPAKQPVADLAGATTDSGPALPRAETPGERTESGSGK
jgi:hypothetical protein